MPPHRFSTEPGIGAELADAMSKAFDAVMAAIEAGGKKISTQSVAQKITQLAHEGKHDVETLTKAVLDSLKLGK